MTAPASPQTKDGARRGAEEAAPPDDRLRPLSAGERESKELIYQRLLKVMDLSLIGELEDKDARHQIRQICERLMSELQLPLSLASRQRIVRRIEDEVLGLGPLEPLLADKTVSDILVNGPAQVYVERHGRLELTDVSFNSDAHLMNIIDRIVSAVGRRVDESSPMVDARLKDGSRVNAIIPPLAIDGPSLSIRRFAADMLTIEDLINLGSLTRPLADILSAIVRARLNVLVSGGTGAGKTTLLNILSGFIPPTERIVTIEDSAELQLRQPHVVRLETRPPNIEGRGAVTQRDLVRNSLRMRPDRIVIGEVRGGEALDMLQAMNTGHDGSLTTVHSNSPQDTLSRLETMVLMAGADLPSRAIREQIAAAIDIIVQQARLRDGSRRVVAISEVQGFDGEKVVLQDIFVYQQEGLDDDGRVIGSFRAVAEPTSLPDLKAMGEPVDPAIFHDLQPSTTDSAA